MEIKPATLEDVDEIVQIGNSVEEFRVSDKVVNFWPKEVLVECINNKVNPIIVAKLDGQIIGFVIANYNSSLKKAIIENVFVNPEHREKEVGRLLLSSLLNELRELDCEYVCSLVETNSNIAIDFYLNNGFNKGINCVWLDKVIGNSFLSAR